MDVLVDILRFLILIAIIYFFFKKPKVAKGCVVGFGIWILILLGIGLLLFSFAIW